MECPIVPPMQHSSVVCFSSLTQYIHCILASLSFWSLLALSSIAVLALFFTYSGLSLLQVSRAHFSSVTPSLEKLVFCIVVMKVPPYWQTLSYPTMVCSPWFSVLRIQSQAYSPGSYSYVLNRSCSCPRVSLIHSLATYHIAGCFILWLNLSYWSND